MRQSPRTLSNSFCGAPFGPLSSCRPSSCAPPAAGPTLSKYVHPCLTARKRVSAVANVGRQEMGGGGGLWVISLLLGMRQTNTLKRKCLRNYSGCAWQGTEDRWRAMVYLCPRVVDCRDIRWHELLIACCCRRCCFRRRGKKMRRKGTAYGT